jgi:hypothetical protein
MISLPRLVSTRRAVPIGVLAFLSLALTSAGAADLAAGARTFIEARHPQIVRGRALADCTETRPDHLIACAPREIVLIEPDAPIANAVYALRPSRERRPYPQVFTWGP